jgi:integrase
VTRIDLPYIRVINPKRGGTYYYFDTGRKNANGGKLYVRLPDVSDPGFGGSYASCKAARTRRANIAARPQAMTFATLVGLYFKSPNFRALGTGTQAYYIRYMELVAREWKAAPLVDVTPADVRELLDEYGDQVGVSNTILKVVRVAFAWAKERSYVEANPAKEIPRLDSTPHAPWPDHILQAGLASDNENVRLMVAILYYTALRISDAAKLTWSVLAENGITVVPQKTRKKKPTPMFIPLHPELRRILESATPRHVTILSNIGGTGPATKESALKLLKPLSAATGENIVTHGLRKNAVIALLEAGCSVAETASISGQSLQLVEHYAAARNQRKLATAAILHWSKGGAK